MGISPISAISVHLGSSLLPSLEIQDIEFNSKYETKTSFSPHSSESLARTMFGPRLLSCEELGEPGVLEVVVRLLELAIGERNHAEIRVVVVESITAVSVIGDVA